MSSKNSRFGFWISTWWPVFGALAVICLESTEMMGADHTNGPFRALVQLLYGPISDAQWDQVHFYIRKSGHFLGYGMVGLAWLRAWRRMLSSRGFALCASLAVACTFLVAGTDELHQTFLPNRTGMFHDVLIDTFGSLVLITIEFLVILVFHRSSLRPRRSTL